jgi:hypothetical protein
MTLLRFFAGQAHEELAFASFAEQSLHALSTISTKLAKHNNAALVPSERKLEYKHCLVKVTPNG